MTNKKLKLELQKDINSGKYRVGELIVPQEYEKLIIAIVDYDSYHQFFVLSFFDIKYFKIPSGGIWRQILLKILP